jgi:aspartate/methionine/tyrosine aminotransferase
MRLPPFALERYFARYEFTSELLLSSSDCESMSISELLALEPGAAEALLGQRLGYTESTGNPSLRREISRLYQAVDDAHVLVHSGAEEAIYVFMNAVLEPGDHLIVHRPCYQSLSEIASAAGCEVSPWQAREENGWALDPDELPRMVRPATRAIVINTPHNPTGFHMGRRQLQETVEFAERSGIILFCDEVYRGLEYDAADTLPAACDLGEHAVSLGVMSKTYGLAGLRIGWVATRNAEVLSRMTVHKDYTTICCSAPSELLAEVALRHAEAIAERNRSIVRENLALLDSFFARHSADFAWNRPLAGPVAFPRLRKGEVNAFCDSLRSRAGVLLLPGGVYGDAGGHFRVGFGRRNMPLAMQRMEDFLSMDPALPGRYFTP